MAQRARDDPTMSDAISSTIDRMMPPRIMLTNAGLWSRDQSGATSRVSRPTPNTATPTIEITPL